MAIVALVSDLIFGSKISATAAALNIETAVVRSGAEVRLRWATARALIVDLAHPSGEGLKLIQEAKADHPGLVIIGFLPHVEAELAAAARVAGADRVFPRSKFTRDLPGILEEMSGHNSQ